MQDKKISELEQGTPTDTDWVVYVDITENKTKKATKAELKGDKGDNATVNVGTTTTLAPGTPASVENVGTETNTILNFRIPKGEQGVQGIPGPKGDTGPAGQNGKDGTGIGDMMGANNLSDLDNKTTARTNLDVYSKEEITSKLEKKANLINGKIPSSVLPSYVDDVLIYDNFSAFPETGEMGKIYIETTNNNTYRRADNYIKIIDTPSAESIKQLYESNPDTNNFSNLYKEKLDRMDFEEIRFRGKKVNEAGGLVSLGANGKIDSAFLPGGVDIHGQTEKIDIKAEDEILVYSKQDDANKKITVENFENYLNRYDKYEIGENVNKGDLLKFNSNGQLVKLELNSTNEQPQDLNTSYRFDKTFISLGSNYVGVWYIQSDSNIPNLSYFYIYQYNFTGYERVKTIYSPINLAHTPVFKDIVNLGDGFFLFYYKYRDSAGDKTIGFITEFNPSDLTLSVGNQINLNTAYNFKSLGNGKFVGQYRRSLQVFEFSKVSKQIQAQGDRYNIKNYMNFCVRNENELWAFTTDLQGTLLLGINGNNISQKATYRRLNIGLYDCNSVYTFSDGNYILYRSGYNYWSELYYFNGTGFDIIKSDIYFGSKFYDNNNNVEYLLAKNSGGGRYQTYLINKENHTLTPYLKISSEDGCVINGLFIVSGNGSSIDFHTLNTNNFIGIAQTQGKTNNKIPVACLGDKSKVFNNLKVGKNYGIGVAIKSNELLLGKF